MILRRVEELRALVRGWKREGAVVGLVPTMGALHEGHLSLVQAAKAGADRVIVTIFVNPRQFNNAADLAKYPRTEEADAALLAPLGVDAVFVPEPDEVYPPGYASEVTVGGVALPLEGALRPGHFAGVATVVTKLFGMTLADRAWFGEKDWQQLQVIRRMVTDLNLPVDVQGVPTLRDPDGLAMSSRNARLSAAARAKAPALHLWMTRMAAGATVAQAEAGLLAAGFERVEYLEFHDAETLGPPIPGHPQRLLAAAWLEGVRLIDNIAA
ncbi:pantoate--beta-alanine ligase [Stagnihabitans tardus]|uniref:Pantothenate synthetase n=1 Tax=Stagnihabitans tardus TaxID=2699202 RepID=A0AAE4YD31_9RHOB|nr:pantoate--beta-alanine ligase [Stagnihabitans tardus]NBZ89048.1 pantoate--beta-alanine ligase [Stagnihabitans tardus]